MTGEEWNAKAKADLTKLADDYYAANCPFWEFVIAVGQWVEEMEKNGSVFFGEKQSYLDAKLARLVQPVEKETP